MDTGWIQNQLGQLAGWMALLGPRVQTLQRSCDRPTYRSAVEFLDEVSVRLYPRLRTDFDDAVAALEAAVAAVGRQGNASSARRVDRDLTMAELDFQLALGSRLGRYLDALVQRPGKGGR